jgi:hypothetical protein
MMITSVIGRVKGLMVDLTQTSWTGKTEEATDISTKSEVVAE